MYKSILRKKNKAGVIMTPDFRAYHKAIGIKTLWHWHKDRVQWDRPESLEINPSIYDQLIFNKSAKNTQWGKSSLRQVVLEKLEIHMQRNEIETIYYTTHTHTNAHMHTHKPKWIKDLKLKHET